MRTLKFISLLLALIFSASAFFACDNGNPTSTDSTSSGSTDSNGTSADTSKPTDNGSTDNPDKEADEIVIFENGEYKVRVICPDSASEMEKKVYNDVRNKLKSITGVMPAYETDFKAYDDDGSKRAGPAILIGETNYDESKELYAETRNAECALKVIGNKIAFAFRTDVDATNAYIRFASYLRNATAERVSFEADIDYKKASNEYLNELPNYKGGSHQIIDCDDDTYMLYAENASMNDFLNYYDEAIRNGFLPYASKTVGDNVFETLITESKYIYMYYRAYDKSVRACIGPIEMLGEEDYSDGLEEFYSPTLSIVGQDESIDCGQGYIFVLPDGRLIVQDGGARFGHKPDYMYEAIMEVAPNSNHVVIAAWIISHPHSDHQRAFAEFTENHAGDDNITVERIIANYVNRDMYQYVRDDGAKESNGSAVDQLRRMVKEDYPTAQFIKAHTGQVYNFGSASIEIIYTVEDYLPVEKFNYVNSASLVARVTVGGTSVMLLADTTHVSGEIIEKTFGSYLKSDMVQLAHHGMAPSNASLYQRIEADVLLWPSTYTHASVRYSQYSNVIDVALRYAKDIYVSDVNVTTISLPYVIRNNKDAEMSKLR